MLTLEVGDGGGEWDGGGDAAPGFLVLVDQLFFWEGSLVLRTAQRPEPCCFSSVLTGLWPLAPVYFCDLGGSMAVVRVPRGARTCTGGRIRVETDQSQRRPCVLGREWGATPPRGGDWGTTPHLGRDWGATPLWGRDWGITPHLGRDWGAMTPRGGDWGSHTSSPLRTRDAVSVGWAGPSTSTSPHAEYS